MPRGTTEHQPLLTEPDPELARSQMSRDGEEPVSDGEGEEHDESGLTASGHHIDDAHQQTT